MVNLSCKKRKRDVSEEDKLKHQASKELKKILKKAVAFETVRLIRKVKQLESEAKAGAEQELELMKGLSIDDVAERGLNSIGLAPLADGALFNRPDTPLERVKDSVLRLKPVKEALAEMDTKATQIRVAKLNGVDPKESLKKNPKKNPKRKKTADPSNDPVGNHSKQSKTKRKVPVTARRNMHLASESAMFVTSLCGARDDDLAGGDKVDKDEIVEADPFKVTKKNRLGQRERKRRAMERDGEAVPENLKRTRGVTGGGGGRGGKSGGSSRDTKGGRGNRGGAPSEAVAPPAPPPAPVVETIEHPSWLAARAAKEKAKIPQFAGKKITFDDDDE